MFITYLFGLATLAHRNRFANPTPLGWADVTLLVRVPLSLDGMHTGMGKESRHCQVPAWRHGGNVAPCYFATAMIFRGMALFSSAVFIIAC